PPFFSCAPSTPYLYTLSLHDALPISRRRNFPAPPRDRRALRLQAKFNIKPELGQAVQEPPRVFRIKEIGQTAAALGERGQNQDRSEEHTSELQSLAYLVCRLLLEKKK